jgi:hypothetical protein
MSRHSAGLLWCGGRGLEKVRHGNLIRESIRGCHKGGHKVKCNGNNKASWEVVGRSFLWCLKQSFHMVKDTGGDSIQTESIRGSCGNYRRVLSEGAELDHRSSNVLRKCHDGVLRRTMERGSFWGVERGSFWGARSRKSRRDARRAVRTLPTMTDDGLLPSAWGAKATAAQLLGASLCNATWSMGVAMVALRAHHNQPPPHTGQFHGGAACVGIARACCLGQCNWVRGTRLSLHVLKPQLRQNSHFLKCSQRLGATKARTLVFTLASFAAITFLLKRMQHSSPK